MLDETSKVLIVLDLAKNIEKSNQSILSKIDFLKRLIYDSNRCYTQRIFELIPIIKSNILENNRLCKALILEVRREVMRDD